VIATKIHRPRRPGDPNGEGLNRKHLRRQIDVCLDRLGTDYVDLLYCHRWDDATRAEEFMRTLDGFVEVGKVNYLGISSDEPDAWKIVKANEIAAREGYEPFTVTQPRYNLVDEFVEAGYMDMCREYDLGVVPWSPLAWGFLTGKYSRESAGAADSTAAADGRFESNYLTERNFEVLDTMLEIAEAVDATPAQVALAYHLHHPDVTAPIVGASSVDQLEENLGADGVSLTDDQFERLRTAKTASLY
jgi:aryl-alcohol dehydrogenase-like predicted oxidoreductase